MSTAAESPPVNAHSNGSVKKAERPTGSLLFTSCRIDNNCITSVGIPADNTLIACYIKKSYDSF